MQAIQTEYKGYKFRSRLEARWAVFFDSMNIEYEYEPEGYEVSFNDAVVRYLPDFYLPQFGCFVEVKPRMGETDATKLSAVLDFGSMPFFHESLCVQSCAVANFQKIKSEGIHFCDFCPGLLLLGQVPNVEWGVVVHPIIRHHKGLIRDYVYFQNGRLKTLNDDHKNILSYFCSEDFDQKCGDSIDLFNTDSCYIGTTRAQKTTCEAYKKARAARFEFGETPC